MRKKLPLRRNRHRQDRSQRGQVSLRLAEREEAPAIAALTNAIFNGKDPLSRPKFVCKCGVEKLMLQGKFLLAEMDQAIVGYAYLEPRMEASRLEILAVSEPQRRSGIGSQLLEAAERLSRSMQCLYMHVRVINLDWEGMRFCRRRGYVDFALEPLHAHEAISPYCHLVKMYKQLDQGSPGF